MPMNNPNQLVDEFKKSGEFDRLRRELLLAFQQGDGISSFTSRVQDIARQRLTSDQKLQYMPPESVHRELMQEMERYPLVERAVADVRMISDPSFVSDIRSSVDKILQEDRRKSFHSVKESADDIKAIPMTTATPQKTSLPSRPTRPPDSLPSLTH